MCITGDFGGSHKHRDEEAVPEGTASSDEPGLWSLQQKERNSSERGCESRVMDGVSDGVCEI